jgi:hypothetical protein
VAGNCKRRNEPSGSIKCGECIVVWRIILKRIFRKWDLVGEGMDWINLVQARGRWQATVNVLRNLRVP